MYGNPDRRVNEPRTRKGEKREVRERERGERAREKKGEEGEVIKGSENGNSRWVEAIHSRESDPSRPVRILLFYLVPFP